MVKQIRKINTRDLVSDAEWQQRVDLAASYQLLSHYGWDDGVFTHNTARVPKTDHFLINPFGLKFNEVNASNLVKIDRDGKKVMDSPYPILEAGFIVHSAIHLGRPDAHCVMHTHTLAGCAVAAQKKGLLMLNQKSMEFYNRIGYHDYEGIADNLEERERMATNLGSNKALVMRNHGLLTIGLNMAQAFGRMRRLHESCELQVMAQSGGSQLIEPCPETCENAALQFDNRTNSSEVAWAAELRMLDTINPGFRD